MRGPILGADGQPIKAPIEPSLELLINAAVETKVNTASDQLRVELAAQHRRDSIAAWIRFAAVAIVGTAVAVFLWFVGPDLVRDWTREFVAKNMNEPLLREAADELMRSRMETYIDTELAEVETQVRSASAAIDSLRAEQEFLLLAQRAQLMDLEAFMAVREIAATEASPFRSRAKEIAQGIERVLEEERASIQEYIPIERIGKHEYQGPFTDDELAERFGVSPDKASPEGVINYARREKRPIFVKDIVSAIKGSNNLRLRNRAAYAVAELTGRNFKAWEVSELETWWADHSQEYPAWPHDPYRLGLEAFRSADCQRAILHFETVMKADKNADKSRAHTIACLCETDQLEAAKQLLPDFSEAGSRWRTWSEAKILLTEGDATGATDMLVQLVKQHLGMVPAGYLVSRTQVWDGVEWERFELARESAIHDARDGHVAQ